MYLNPSEISFDTLYQGDVIKSFPFFIFNELIYLRKNAQHFEIVDNMDSYNKEESYLAIKSKLSSIIIISQTCDIQRMETVMIAPIYDIKTFEENGVLKDGKSGLIKKRKTFHWFYLPKIEGITEDSFADFTSMHYVNKSLLFEKINNKELALSDWGRHHLDHALSNFFGRPIEDKYS